MNTDTIGGVSPLKARQSSRGGKDAGRATKTTKQRGGFAKSKGKRGAGGANVGGYNVQTRFAPSKRTIFPASGGTTSFDTTKQAASSEPPYYYDKDGNFFEIDMNNFDTGINYRIILKLNYMGEEKIVDSSLFVFRIT